jgi:hypothetical protein
MSARRRSSIAVEKALRASSFILIAAALLLGACGQPDGESAPQPSRSDQQPLTPAAPWHAAAPSVAQYDADWKSASQPSEKASAFRALSRRVGGFREVGGERRSSFCKALRADLFTTKFRAAQPEFATDDVAQLSTHFKQCPSFTFAAMEKAASDQVVKDRFEVYRVGGDYALLLFARSVVDKGSAKNNLANVFHGILLDLRECRAAGLDREELFSSPGVPRAMAEPILLLRGGEYYFGGVASSHQTDGADADGDYALLWLATVFRPDGPPRPANAFSCQVTWCRSAADAPCKLPVSRDFRGTQE